MKQIALKIFQLPPRKIMLVIFLTAMLVRMVFIIPKGNRIAPPLRDQNTYYSLGRALVEDGYLGPPKIPNKGPYLEYRDNNPHPLGELPENQRKMFERWDAEKRYYGVMEWGKPSSFFEPGYPLLAAGMYYLFGDRLFFHRLILALLSSLTCLLVYGTARRLFNDKAGIIAGFISVFYPYFIFYTVILMSETLIIFLLALSMYYFVRLRNENKLFYAALFGISLGLTFLTRSIVLGILPFLLLYLVVFNPKRLLVPALVSLAFFCIAISPWVIRNYNLHGKLVLLCTRGGYNIWFRNNPFYYDNELKALGITIPEKLLKDIKYKDYLEYPVFSPEQGEIERNQILTAEGMKFLKSNPELFTYLCWIRFKTLIGFQGTFAQGIVYILTGLLTFGIILPLGVISFFINIGRWKDTIFLLAIFGYFIAVYTLTHDGIRYRLPADPYIIILASLLLTQIAVYFQGKFTKSSK